MPQYGMRKKVCKVRFAENLDRTLILTSAVVLKKKAAMDSLGAIEKQFATLRDR